MTNITSPETHAWTSPKLPLVEIAALKARWATLDPQAALRAPPFGRTAEDRIDLRYIPLRSEGELNKGRPIFQRAQFRNCDFTGAQLHWLSAERSIFENCVFDRAVMTDFTDRGSSFSNCTFVETDLRLAGLGTDLNTSKPGDYQSLYRDCLFQDMKTAKLLVGDPIFVNGRFVFKRLRAVDWECAGFWGCRFEGTFEDMTFRGEYSAGNAHERKGHPQKAGLHATSFVDAKLRWIAARDQPQLEQIELPSDGNVFIADNGRIAAEAAGILDVCPDDATRKAATLYLNVVRGYSSVEPQTFISRYDMFEPDEPQNEPAGTWVYAHLKKHYRLA